MPSSTLRVAPRPKALPYAGGTCTNPSSLVPTVPVGMPSSTLRVATQPKAPPYAGGTRTSPSRRTLAIPVFTSHTPSPP